MEVVNSLLANFIKLRNRLIEENNLINKEDCYEFAEDYIFSSPSAAASIVMGRTANGFTEWKQKDGKTLKDFELNNKTTNR